MLGSLLELRSSEGGEAPQIDAEALWHRQQQVAVLGRVGHAAGAKQEDSEDFLAKSMDTTYRPYAASGAPAVTNDGGLSAMTNLRSTPGRSTPEQSTPERTTLESLGLSQMMSGMVMTAADESFY